MVGGLGGVGSVVETFTPHFGSKRERKGGRVDAEITGSIRGRSKLTVLHEQWSDPRGSLHKTVRSVQHA